MQHVTVLDNDSKLSPEELRSRQAQYSSLAVMFGLAAIGGIASLIFLQVSMLRSQSAAGFESFALYYAVVGLLTALVLIATGYFWVLRTQYARHILELAPDFVLQSNNLRNVLIFSPLCVMGFSFFLQKFIDYLQNSDNGMQERVIYASLILFGSSLFFILIGLFSVMQWALYMDYRIRQQAEPSQKISWARRTGLLSVALSAGWIFLSVMGKGANSVFYFMQFSDASEVLGFGFLAASCAYAVLFGALSLWTTAQTYFFYNRP